MTATLTIRTAPEFGAGVRYFEVDCPHGTVKAFTDGPPSFPDSTIVGYLLNRHDQSERCGCTRELWERYGPVPNKQVRNRPTVISDETVRRVTLG